MRALQLMILPVALALPAFAGGDAEPLSGWMCRNMDLEISCHSGVCESEDVFTPMDISLAEREMTVCAYSGCWEGAPQSVHKDGRFETYVGIALPWSHNAESTADASITVDTMSNTATILVSELYASPGICKRFSAAAE